MPEGEAPLASIDRLVHEPARLLVLASLYVVESADYTFLVRQTGLTWGNLSSHIAKLEGAGYITVEKTFEGRRPKTRLALTPAGRRAVADYRARMKQVLDGLPDDAPV
jgi:DNA-binding MarR family transcriptional regulator